MKAERTYRKRVARFATYEAAVRYAEACDALPHLPRYERAFIAPGPRRGFVVIAIEPMTWKGDKA